MYIHIYICIHIHTHKYIEAFIFIYAPAHTYPPVCPLHAHNHTRTYVHPTIMQTYNLLPRRL